MLNNRQPLSARCTYTSYLDGEYPSFKDRFKHIYQNSRNICRSLLGQKSDQNLTFLTYHSVSDDSKAGFVYPSYATSAEIFEAHIKHVVGHYHVLSIDDYFEHIESKKTPPKRSLMGCSPWGR